MYMATSSKGSKHQNEKNHMQHIFGESLYPTRKNMGLIYRGRFFYNSVILFT